MITEKEILTLKVSVRKLSRKLIQTVFLTTEGFPINDQEGLALQLRKKALSVSSFLSHGTGQNDKEEQGKQFIIVMTELRELLKLTALAKKLNYINEKREALIRLSISDVIIVLNKLVKLQGNFN